MKNHLRKIFQNQTLESFNFQFKEIPTGRGLLSDDFFRNNVTDFISKEELCIAKEWFKDKEILDAGCGNGRWTYGFLKLGANVMSIDNSEVGLAYIQNTIKKDFPKLELKKENLLDLSDEIKKRKYDLVFCWGVLHHTGDINTGLKNISSLIRKDGLIYLYLYGKNRYTFNIKKFVIEIMRLMLSVFPFKIKKKIMERIIKDKSIVHGYFDVYSPLINILSDYETVKRWLRELGFKNINRTIKSTDLFIRAYKDHCSAEKYFLPFAKEPYWFQKLN